MAKAPAAPQATVVTVSDGNTLTTAIQDPSGRIITAKQIQQIRDSQQLELEKVTALRDQLVAGETAAIELIINQARDEFQRRIAVLDLQKADLNASLQRLKDGDRSLRQEIIEKMTARLKARVDLTTGSRDRSDQLLERLRTAEPGATVPAFSPGAPAPPAPPDPPAASPPDSPPSTEVPG